MKYEHSSSVSLSEISKFAVKTGGIALGLYGIGMSCRTGDFLKWISEFNPQRGNALTGALNNHDQDELDLLRSISQLTDKEGHAVARRVATTDIKVNKGKLHQFLLQVASRTTTDILSRRQ